ncbi:MAG: hypothetical protein HZA16_03420, partial [Nitrospirae bacterium]|nr:hypothetical protein [Nitrospirota bacterium]
MYQLLKRQTLTGILILGLLALNACGGGGGGNGGGNPPPPGSGNPPPGGGQQAVTTPQADAFNWTGNTRMTVAAANGVLANDPANTVISAADTATTLGGVVNVNTATGAFTYDPPLGAQNQADTFTYTAGSTPVTVTINLVERVWYVRNNDAGANQGNDQAPFLTLAQAGAASDVNDTIFVFAGNGTATGQNNGITLLSGQKLIGEGIGLSVNANQIVNAGANASISNAGLAVG